MVGSLMSGWNAQPGVPPKGFREDNDEEQGLSPRLRKRLSLSRSSAPVLQRPSPALDPLSPKAPTTPRVGGGTPKEGNTPNKDEEAQRPEPYRWWTKVDSFHESEPYEEDRSAWKVGSYTPQKDIARVHVPEAAEPAP